MIRHHLENAGRSDRGLVRPVNEDCVAVLPQFGLVVVADGMGGANAGEIASHLAVESIAATITSQINEEESCDFAALADEAIKEANDIIYRSALDTPEFSGMGTTIVLGIFLEDQLIHAHVGDSRLYRVRNERIECLTLDHSVIQELVDRRVYVSLDEAQAAGVKNNVLTRVLGIEDTVDIDLDSAKLLPDDVYLFCTDGLTNMVNNETIVGVVRQHADSLEAMADQLIAIACENGGTDNISLVLVRI